jgi:hypothetical protein
MTQEAETLTQLVADRVGEGRELTYRAFQAKAIDEKSGYQPSVDVLWKVGTGKAFKLSPELVGAIAAGLGLPPGRVQAAAAYQYTGLVATLVEGAAVLHEPGVDTDTPAIRREVGRLRERAEGKRD